MPNIVVVGAQWGDEGKGKIVDVLAPHVGRRRPLPGRQQRGPHRGGGQGEVRPPVHPVRHPPQRGALRDRLRGGDRPRLAHRGDGVAGPAGSLPGRQPLHLQERAPDHALPSRARPRLGVAGGRPPHRHHRQGRGPRLRGQGGPHRHPHGGPARRAAVPGEARVQHQAEEPAAARDLRRADVHGGEHPRDLHALRGLARALRHRHRAAAQPLDRGRALGALRGRAGHHARHRPRDVPVHHLVQHHLGRALPPGPACRPPSSTACSASPRPTAPASAAGRS